MTQYIKAAARPVTNQVKFVTNRVKLVTNQKRDQERMTCVKKIKSGENKKALTRGGLEVQKSCSRTSQLSFFALAMLFMSLISFLDLTLSCTEIWFRDKDDHCYRAKVRDLFEPWTANGSDFEGNSGVTRHTSQVTHIKAGFLVSVWKLYMSTKYTF